ncbi:uncharacterized protein PG998_001028 [Apiospora kogelbergensis]|uniref:Uncharacterized protein n=1 Tax=Apiospora kogelbergensis TaxID=1337665 RepID=A0AAW0QRR3_9PEZI
MAARESECTQLMQGVVINGERCNITILSMLAERSQLARGFHRFGLPENPSWNEKGKNGGGPTTDTD